MPSSRARISRSREGFYPSRWGSHLWHFLHVIALNYPTKPSREKRKNYMSFFDNLKHILPCKKCRTNYATHPIPSAAFKSRQTLFRAVYDLHCRISKELGKKTRTPSYDTVIRRFERMRYARGTT